MATQDAGSARMTSRASGKAVRHARIELPEGDYGRLKAEADRYHISVAAYIRLAVIERIERDERTTGHP